MGNYVSQLFEHNQPMSGKIAVVDRNGTRKTSWRELYEKTCAVAAYAASLNLQGVVPVRMPRCTETVEVLLGLGLAGLGTAPLTADTPPARLAVIEEQSGNRAWTRTQYDAAMEYGGTDFTPVAFAADAPAYVVYTSGSTGVPKGVVLTNDTVEKSYRRMASPEFLDLRQGDKVLQNASFSFVALMIDLYAPLYMGCETHILPEEARTDMALMTAYLNRHGITSMFITPKPLSRLGDAPSLRVVCVGGERVSELGPKGYRLLNVWGMSETAALALGYPITEPMKKTPIGKSMGDFRCYILDEAGKPAQEGELCLSGATALGYYQRPDLTRAFFEPNPFSDDEGHRTLMHTGDIVRRLEDGNLLYLNRKDFMIKINGQRVEPGEAEAVIEAMPGIRGAAVKGFTDEDGHSYLCAYYVSDTVSEEAIRAELARQLPSYMIPAFYQKLEALPLNANGKLDRKALTAPQVSGLQEAYAEAENAAEAALCRAFAQVLKVRRVGANDDFFRLGGDSIRAMTVVSLAGLPGVTTAAILSGRTPRRIAALAAQSREDVYSALTSGLAKAPLTDSQMGIYLSCSNAPQSVRYNIPFCVSLDRREGMTARSVQDCVDGVLALHPALYARILSENGTVFMQRCPMPEQGICLAAEGAETAPEDEWKDFVRPFDLSRAPLCRARAVLTSQKVHILMDMHHIVFDGSSVAILVRELCQALAGNRPSPERVDAFGLYEAQQRLGERDHEEAKAHFEALLSGVEIDSNLLFDRRSDSIDPPAQRVTLLADGLDFDILHEHGITESTLFMGVFGYALAKMTGQKQSLFAVAESGRKQAALENTVSMMVRTLPVTMEIDEKKSALDLLAALQSQFYASVDHDTIPFARLAEEYGVSADVMFVYQSDLLTGGDTPAGRADIDIRPTGSAISNFNAAVYKQEDGHRVVLEYRSDLYDRQTVERFGELFVNAARVFAAGGAPESIRLLGEKDRAFLAKLNQTESHYSREETIVDIFRRHAEMQPDKVVVRCEDRQYTYSQADELTDRIAAYLSGHGIGKGQAVGVLIPRGEYMLLASLGILKAGAMYQPLDPSYPAERLNFLCQDSAARLVIADRALRPILTEYEGDVLYLDEIPALPPAVGTIQPPCPEDGVVLLYTSGTTGLPKGCLLEHSNLTAMAHAYAKLTEMDGDCTAAAYASYGFDAHMADLYPILSCGGTVVILPDDIRLDLQAIKDACEKNHVTHLILTTQLAVQFAIQFPRLSHLRSLVAGGEKMVSLTPPVSYRLLNCYGPTECTVLETAFGVDRLYEDIPIGTAIANTKLYVVDGFDRQVPVGAPGELVISGPQVGRGYLNRPEKTAECFGPNPFEPAPAPGYERCYRTGDIVRFGSDGNLLFVGRRDMQVKIRGFRIELSEVERVIMDYPGVKSATVVAVDAPGGGKCLNAYLVGEGTIDLEGLNEYIRSVKPPYMVPAASMQLDSIPLTVNGKVDKKKLPSMKVHFEDVTKPENELQQRIFDKAAETVGTAEFGIHTDLYLAGLSSLGSIRLCALLAEAFGIPFQIRNLKKNPTVAKLETFIRKAQEGSKPEPAPEAAPEAVRYAPDHPISKTMEGIFTECIGKPDSTFYNIPYLLKLSPEIDPARLKAALVSAVEAHPYLKTELYTDSEGHIRQHRRLEDGFTPEMIGELTAESLDELLPTLVRPFSITEGRLFEITLIHADSTLCLFLNFHHIISDGTSIYLFLNDVERAYAGQTPEPETFSGFEVSEEEQAARSTEDLEEARDYYTSLLDGLDRDFLPLPDRSPDSPPAAGKLTATLRFARLGQVRRFCEKNRVSLNAFFVSVFGFVLSRYAGTEYAVFNTIYNGRNDSRTADTFAMLVKTLPVVCDVDTKTAGELTARMAAQLMDSMANDLYSYGEIARNLNVNNDVMFIYQGDSFERSGFCGSEAEEISLTLSENKVPLALQTMLKNGEILCELEYDPQRFTEKLMLAFLSAFDMACAGFAREMELREISLLSADAEGEMEQHNDTQYPYDRSQTITGLFLDRVHTQPEKLCVAYRNERLTYGEAGELSGRLAGYLMEKGIGAGDVVPILIHRTENMVITAHGVVRAGAAYLGLDPTYPPERLEFMIQDSGASCLIVERSLMDRIPGYAGEVLYTDEIAALPVLTQQQEEAFRTQPRHQITPENDALYVYSSGTTGLPKGSVLQHKAIVCFYHNYTRNMEIAGDARVATYASFGFDGGAMDVFCVPMSGAALFVIPDEIRLDLSGLEQFFVRNAITSGFMTTQVGTMFVANTKCRTLKHFIVGGERLIPVVAPAWVNFQNGYGPSETMCYVNSFTVRDTGSLQPIGRVSGNTKEYIIDKFGNRLPYGACGELCISGGQMGRGYHNRPEKTAEAFVENPFCREAGYERMYRTGDVVRMLPDGNYDFVGRRDGQVKIRGFRVELSEVEMQLRQFPGVENALVTAFDNPAGGKYLAAYAVAEGTLDTQALKAFIAKEKPEYMVPAAILQIPEIPLTANGKVDMKKLPKPEPRALRKGVEPADEREERLCSIFAQVLGLDKVYADDDFFAIGGSSISAIQVVVKCEQAGMPLVYKNLFANPTAQQLNAFLCHGQKEDISAGDLETGDGHNYAALRYNVQENLPKIKNSGVGDVLLTGVTGFLGSHVFRELLESTDGQVVCLVRSKAGMSAQERLEMMMVYYFEQWYTREYSRRVTVIDADMEEDDTSDRLREISFDTIINCAANVKHFAAGDELLGANFTGVERLITLAEEKQARLIQISSLSVCGESVNGSVPAGYVFRETDLNIGQSLENKYIYSKYLAEQAVIDAVSEKRIRGKIIRLGNLMARFGDSEFQVNAGTNGFLRLFLGFHALGCFPVGMMDAEVEFSPIDAVAKAVVLLSGTPDDFTVFHAKNCNTIHYSYLLSAIRNAGKQIEIVEDQVFDRRLERALADEKNVERLGGLLAYRSESNASLSDSLRFSDAADQGREIRVKLGSDTAFTRKALYRLGFAWPLISTEYLDRMVQALLEMNFFSE